MEPKPVMRVVSVNVGLPRTVEWKGRTVTTGIFKQPVAGPVMMRQENLDGDRQADLTVHGGPDKAVYVYPAEYYDYWRSEFPDLTLEWGMFGENLTVEGLLDRFVNIGDRFKIGDTELMVTQPRMPCYKLGLKFGRDDILKRFLDSRFSGFYVQVLKEGQIEAGDLISRQEDPAGVKVTEVVDLYTTDKHNLDGLKRVVMVEALPASWRDYFLDKLEGGSSSN